MIHSLSDFNPISVRFYRWNYAWETLKDLYVQKQKEAAVRTNSFCEFLVSLATAALGGSSKGAEEVGLDTGDGLEEMSDEQLAEMKEMLGEHDFNLMYGKHL